MKKWLWILIPIIGIVIYFSFSNQIEKKFEPSRQIIKEPAELKKVLPKLEEIETVVQTDELDRLMNLWSSPRLDALKQAVEANPHHAPVELVEFAEDFSKIIDLGIKNKDSRKKVVDRLVKCIDDSKGEEVIQVRLVCFDTLKGIAEDFPEFSSEFQRLKARYPSLATMILSDE